MKIPQDLLNINIVWEYDYHNDKENIIKKCIEFLNK